MKKADILQLGSLARIRLEDSEVASFGTDIQSILAYVSKIDELVTPTDMQKKVGPVYNIFRADVVTNQPGMYSEVLLAQMPDTKGDFLRVKKILNQTD